MAEKVKLFDLEINSEQVLKDLSESRKRTEELKKEIKALTEAEEDNGEEIEKLTIALQLEQKEIRETQKRTKELLGTREENLGTLERLQIENKNLRNERVKLNLETEEGQKRLQEINRQLDINNSVIKENSDALKIQKLTVGSYKDEIKKALDETNSFTSGLTDTARGFAASTKAALKFIATPIGATIAVLATAFKTLQAAFSRSISSQEKLNKITGRLSNAFNVALDAIIPLIDFILDTALAALDQVGEAVSFVIDKLADWGIISEQTRDKVTKATNETTEAIDNLASAERQLVEADIELQKQQLKFQTQAEKLRQIRDDESKSINERIKANKQLGALLETQAASETKVANIALKIAKQKQQIDGVNLNNIRELGDAEIKLAEIEERIVSQRSEQLTNINALEKERRELLLEQKDIEEKAQKERLQRNTEVTEAIRRNENALVEETLKLQQNLIQELAISGEKAKEQKALDLAQQQELVKGNIFAELELQKQALIDKETQEVQAATERGLKTTAIEAKFSKARQEINKAENAAKLSLAGDFLGNIAQIAGEGTAVGKAAAIAQTTISTYQAAQGAYASLAPIPFVGPVLGIAAAGAAVAAGIANVKKIVSTKSGLPEGGAGGGGSTPSPSIASPTAIPQTPISAQVGQGIISRDSVQQQNQNTIQTVIVADQVTAKQMEQKANNNTSNA